MWGGFRTRGLSAGITGSIFYFLVAQNVRVTSYNIVLQKVCDFCIHAAIPSPPYSQTHPAGFLNLNSILALQVQPSLHLAKSK